MAFEVSYTDQDGIEVTDVYDTLPIIEETSSDPVHRVTQDSGVLVVSKLSNVVGITKF